MRSHVTNYDDMMFYRALSAQKYTAKVLCTITNDTVGMVKFCINKTKYCCANNMK